MTSQDAAAAEPDGRAEPERQIDDDASDGSVSPEPDMGATLVNALVTEMAGTVNSLAATTGSIEDLLGEQITTQDERDQALAAAAKDGDRVAMAAELAAGASVNAVEKGTRSPAVLLAASHGHIRLMRSLVLAGADIHKANRKGRVALHAAAFHGHLEAVHLLLENGSAIDRTDSEGATALILAARRGRTAVVRLLLQKGADKMARTLFEGRFKTALDNAEQNGHAEIADMLRQPAQHQHLTLKRREGEGGGGRESRAMSISPTGRRELETTLDTALWQGKGVSNRRNRAPSPTDQQEPDDQPATTPTPLEMARMKAELAKRRLAARTAGVLSKAPPRQPEEQPRSASKAAEVLYNPEAKTASTKKKKKKRRSAEGLPKVLIESAHIRSNDQRISPQLNPAQQFSTTVLAQTTRTTAARQCLPPIPHDERLWRQKIESREILKKR